MVLRKVGDKCPRLGKSAYVDESAQVIGEVVLNDEASVWPLAVLRADDDRIDVGMRSAVLDAAFAEAPRGRPVTIGRECIVSHAARLHGCAVGNNVLVGIGAIILDNASIGEGSVIAAGTLITPGTKIPPSSFVMGAPGKVVRGTSDSDSIYLRSEIKVLIEKAKRYSALGQ